LDSTHLSSSLALAQNWIVFWGAGAAPGPPRAASVVWRQFLSTVAKRLYSVGSCYWMSPDEKMGSRYIHAR
jgi:hypothetical protein